MFGFLSSSLSAPSISGVVVVVDFQQRIRRFVFQWQAGWQKSLHSRIEKGKDR